MKQFFFEHVITLVVGVVWAGFMAARPLYWPMAVFGIFVLIVVTILETQSIPDSLPGDKK